MSQTISHSELTARITNGQDAYCSTCVAFREAWIDPEADGVTCSVCCTPSLIGLQTAMELGFIILLKDVNAKPRRKRKHV